MRTHLFIFAAASIAAFTACNDKASSPDIESGSSDESSNHSWKPESSSEQDSPEWSSSAMSSSSIPPYSSSEHIPHALSSSAEPYVDYSSSIEESSSSEVIEPSPEIVLDKDGFATVADVYKSLASDEKAVFIIRHSEREDNVALETVLTANGIQMAQDLGATLKSEEEFSYVTSGFVRTNPDVTYENSSSLLRVAPRSCAIWIPFAVSTVSNATLSSRSEWRMIKTAFSSEARLL